MKLTKEQVRSIIAKVRHDENLLDQLRQQVKSLELSIENNRAILRIAECENCFDLRKYQLRDK